MSEIVNNSDNHRSKRRRNHEFLPHDLHIDILYNLPVKSLGRFQCVCKSWHDLIRSRSFAIDHYRHTASRNDGILWASHNRSGSNVYDFYFMDPRIHEFCFMESVHQWATKAIKQKIPLILVPSKSFICNGVICIQDSVALRFVLYNPIMNESSVFPRIPGDERGRLTLATWGIGFGLVPSTSKFMVVRIAGGRETWGGAKLPFTVSVCVEGSSAWRSSTKPDLPPVKHILTLSKGEYADGVCHWLVRYKKEKRILWRLLSFDMEDETLYWTSLPESSNDGYNWFLLNQNESISYLCCPVSSKKGCCIVWSRNGDRYDGSWIRQYAFKISHLQSFPIMWWKNLLLLRAGVGTLTLVDLYSGVEKVIYLDIPLILSYSVYKESLFSVRS